MLSAMRGKALNRYYILADDIHGEVFKEGVYRCLL
jgi:hypothetical protein